MKSRDGLPKLRRAFCSLTLLAVTWIVLPRLSRQVDTGAALAFLQAPASLRRPGLLGGILGLELLDPAAYAADEATARQAQTLATATGNKAPDLPLPQMPPGSPEDMLIQMANKYLGGGAATGDGANSFAPSLVALGIGALVLTVLFTVFKFLVVGAGGLYAAKEIDQQFGKEGRKTSRSVDKFIRRLTGEPLDLLDERRLRVVRMNDEVVSFQASLAEQTTGAAAGAVVRAQARRKRFLGAWTHVFDELSLTVEERQKVEQAVLKYSKQEQDRQESLAEARSAWLNSLLDNSWAAGWLNRFKTASSLEQELKFQEELLADIRKAVPDAKLSKLSKTIKDNVDLTWLAGLARSKDGGDAPSASHVYVLAFDGDATASGVTQLSQEVTAILSLENKPREVVLQLRSPGGTVTGYGLAGAQLMRFRQHGVPLVVCVDELAASGGYLMACCADTILCGPFAAIGSIGVIAGVPNASERLDREGLKVIQTTAGKWKRTVDPFQAPTPEALEKAQDDVMMIYRQFSSFVKENRPALDIEKVATGEVWFGPEALARGLVDKLQTSSDYLLEHMTQGNEVFALRYSSRPTGLAGSLGGGGGASVSVAQLAEAAGALGAAADAARAAGALDGTQSTLQGLEALRRAGSLLAPAASAGSWPMGSVEPRMETRGPMGLAGNEHGF